MADVIAPSRVSHGSQWDFRIALAEPGSIECHARGVHYHAGLYGRVQNVPTDVVVRERRVRIAPRYLM